ncbi:MAG: hypothetical protein ACXVAX_11470 [Pseudobdellovibrio sp.]
MSRNLRNYLSTFLFAYCAISLVLSFYLFDLYFKTHPKSPAVNSDYIVPLNSHGAVVFVSAAESAGLALLHWSYMIIFLLLFCVIPKEVVSAPANAGWRKYLSVRYRTDLQQPSKKYVISFFSSCALVSAIFYFFGNDLVKFALSLGYKIIR